MAELSEGAIHTPESYVTPEPIGMRIIGDVDPRTLSRDAFENSPDMLFHGSPKPFSFSPDFDYRSPEYCTNTDGSQTLGEGFYTTDARDVAENYSRVRQNKADAPAHIVSLLPYQARMLDLRAKDNIEKNAPVPQALFDKWFQHYKEYFFDKEKRQDMPWWLVSAENDYFQFLVRAKQLGKPLDLRVMLDTTPNAELNGNNLPSPPYMKLFSNFMSQEGYDGLVSIEGGEGNDKKNHPSYVVFNLQKIGTYDSWHQESSKK